MKRNLLFLSMLIASIIGNNKILAQTMVEHFNYPIGDSLESNQWVSHSGTNNPIFVVNGNLSYLNYPNAIGNSAYVMNVGKDNNRQFTTTPISSDSLYFAMLVKIDSAKTAGDYFFHTYRTGASTSYLNRIYVKLATNGNLSFGILKGTAAANIVWSDSIYSFTDTHLLVLKIKIVPGVTNDIPSLFIDPVVSATEPTFSTIIASDLTSADYLDFDRIALRQGAAASAPKLQVDEIRVGTSWLNAVTETVVDVASISVTAPINSPCGSASDTVKVKIKHLSGVAASSIPVYAQVTKPDNSVILVNNTVSLLPVGDSLLVNVGTVNTTTAGVYHVKAWTSLTGDPNQSNDTIQNYSFTVASTLSTPFIDDFESVNASWQFNNMSIIASNTHGNSSAALSAGLNSSTPNVSAVFAQQIAPIAIHTHFIMNYRIIDASTHQGIALQPGDSLFLEVSTNCQSSFTRIANINSTNHQINTNYQRFITSLSAFTGNNVIFRIIGLQTVGNYIIDIDSVEIRNADLFDMAVLSRIAPVSKSCGVANDPITAIFKNNGDAPVQNIPVSVQFFRPYNPPLVTFYDTIPSVILPGAQLTFTFDSIINTLVSGKYTMLIKANLAKDTALSLGHTSNNTLIDSVFTYNSLPVPYQESFSSISYLNDYSTSFSFDNTNGNMYQLINSGFTSASIDLIHKVGPLSATHSLFFKYKFTDQSDNAVAMANDDSLAVYISTDCGATYTLIYTVNNVNHTTSNQWTTKQVSLSAFNGQSVLVSMILKSNATNRKFSLDNIVIDGNPIISISPDTSYYCAGQTATINPTGSVLYDYEWVDKSNPTVVISNTKQLQVLTTGYYKVKATNGAGLYVYDSVYVFFRPLPLVTLVFGNAMASICPNASVVALAGQSPVGGTGHFTGVGVTGNQFNPQTAGVGTHLITYTYTDSVGCSNAAIDTIVVTPITAVALSLIPDFCLNALPYVFTEGTPAGGVYSGAGVSGGNFNPANSTVGNHVISYTYTDVYGCAFSANDTLNIKSLPNVFAGNDVAICAGDSITLNATGGVSYVWNTSATGSYILVSPATMTNYVVTASAANGCTKADSVKVTVKPIPVVQLPAFDTICMQQGLTLLTGGSATPLGGTSTYSGAGVSNNYFNPIVGLGPHNIRFTYTLDGCSAFAENSIFVENCTGVESYTNAFQLTLNPNPAEMTVTIAAQIKGTSATLTIFDSFGKIISVELVAVVNGVLFLQKDISTLPSGLYFVNIVTESGVASMKLIKK